MGNKWIIDVLADLRTFAQQNDLPLLADQLVTVSHIAAVEIASEVEGAPLKTARSEQTDNRPVLARVGGGHRS